jgi:hypothetical protein
MQIKWLKDVKLEMVKFDEKKDITTYHNRKFKKGDVSEVELTNIPWSEDWQFSFMFKNKYLSSVNVKYFTFVAKKDKNEIKEMLKKYPIEN